MVVDDCYARLLTASYYTTFFGFVKTSEYQFSEIPHQIGHCTSGRPPLYSFPHLWHAIQEWPLGEAQATMQRGYSQ
jgi:hypothetical protein